MNGVVMLMRCPLASVVQLKFALVDKENCVSLQRTKDGN